MRMGALREYRDLLLIVSTCFLTYFDKSATEWSKKRASELFVLPTPEFKSCDVECFSEVWVQTHPPYPTLERLQKMPLVLAKTNVRGEGKSFFSAICFGQQEFFP